MIEVIMKALLVIFVAILGCQAISDDEVSREWKKFMIDFDKTYKSPREHQRRLSIFKDNLEKIEIHNGLYSEGKVSYLQGITQFTDWTPEEFHQYVNKYKMVSQKSSKIFSYDENVEVPDSMDWRAKGAVREVKDQGRCGSCWSFSATGALEGAATITKGLNLSLSEQNLIDCATAKKYNNFGCNGGTINGAFQYVIDKGITVEWRYPYSGGQMACRQLEYFLKATGYVDVEGNDGRALLQAVATIGPISVALEATSNLQNYKSGVLDDSKCTGQVNHGVLVVGYGTENGKQYWLVKNSWGAKWGEAGYFKLLRNGNMCGILKMPSYPLV